MSAYASAAHTMDVTLSTSTDKNGCGFEIEHNTDQSDLTYPIGAAALAEALDGTYDLNCGYTQADLTYEVLDVSTTNAITTYPWLTSISTGSLGVDLSA